MAKSSRKRKLTWIGIGLAVIAIAVLGLRFYKARKSALPKGIVSGNGRIEAKLVDLGPREPLRVKQIFVDEGALVQPGQVLVQMDTDTLQARLAESNAGIAEAIEKVAEAQAAIVKVKSDIELALIELKRSQNLVREGAGSKRELDVRRTAVATQQAALKQAEATLQAAQQQVQVARANAETIQTRINDATLRAPVVGRVLYRLAEPGEVLPSGGKALTLVDLSDVYMEIFLPADQAAAVKLGNEARITVDYEPKRSIPGYVSFVSPEAQFTPKQVETKSEREKLMFRVKIQLPRELAAKYIERLKTGIRGVGYVKVKDSAVWPARLQNLVTTTPEARR